MGLEGTGGTGLAAGGRPRCAKSASVVAVLGCLLFLAGCSSAFEEANLDLSGMDVGEAQEYPVHGIDVAKYQNDIDWSAAGESGVAFAWIKATEGGDRLDERFLENWKKARAAGVPRGAYHFWYHCRPGIEQARWFIENVPKERGALPPVIDVEWTPHSPTCTKRPPREDIVAEVTAMSNALERHYGQRPILYIPIDVHRDRMVGSFPSHEFWLRAVADHPDNVYEDRDFVFWQYTATGSVPGVEGDVDRNAFAGTREDWARWLEARVLR